ncbi:MAG: hypothetical protein RLY78_205 [Pseudomonadota bacterium]|jgi:general secretion pathway protein F
MPEFEARLHEATGTVRRVRVTADDAQAVAAALGVPPTALLSVRPAPLPRAAAVAVRPAGRGPALELRQFSQELAELLDAGIPLLESLQTLQERRHDAGQPLAPVLAALSQGRSLSQALAEGLRPAEPLLCALVAASERSGQLVPTLRDYAAWRRWSGDLAARLQAALVYPALLLLAGLLVVLFLLLYVLPRFAGVFDGLGQDVPLASRLLIDAGVWAAAHPLALLATLAAPGLLATLAWRLPGLRAALRHAGADLLWRVPGLGPRLRLVALARLYRCLGLLLAAGVPALEALALAGAVLPARLRPAADRAREQLRCGQRLSQALQEQDLCTPVARRMLRVGESSGQLDRMLARAAAFHDEEIAQSTELLTRLINPLLMLVLGTVIGGIVVLMYLPIFTLMEQVQ